MSIARRVRALAAPFAVASLAFASLGTGCSSTDPSASPIAQKSARIIGGTTDTADTFVVGIDIGGNELCSGTLIAPNLVLTARHCVSRTTQTVDCTPGGYYTPKVLQDYPASYFHVTTSQNLYGGTNSQRWSVSNVYYVNDQSCPNSANVVCDLCGYDLALLELSRNSTGFPNVTLATPAFAPPKVNDSHTSIGYGCQSTESAGCNPVGYRMDLEGTACSAVWGYDIDINGRVCGGDSGGPYYDRATGTVYGALSRGDQDCTTGIYTRVDVHMAWLQAKAQLAAQHGGYTAPAWVTQPAPPQPAPLKGIGEPCSAGAECVALDPVTVSGNCHRWGAERRCSQICDPTNLPCPSGYDCVSGNCWPHSDNPPPSTVDSGVPPADTGVVEDTGVAGDDAGTDPGDTAPGTTDQPVTSTSSGGCALGRSEDRPPRPQPWIVGVAAVGLALAARRRR
jgi:hypothetical protein